MARWPDLVPRQETTSQKRSPRRARPSKFIVHTADGYYEGTISWQKGANSVSSHFVNGKNVGEVAQMVDTEDEAWTQSDANRYSLSSENAGFGDRGEPLTPWQLEINAQLYARAHREYPETLPLQLMTGPDDSGLGWHGMGGDAWGGHDSCPGTVIVAQLPQILTRATQIVIGDINMPKVVHQEGQGWWLVGNGAAEPIATEDKVNDLVRAYGPVVVVNDQGHFGIPPKPVPPVTVALSEKDKADIIAGLAKLVPTADQVAAAIGALQASAERASADVLDGPH